MRSFRCGCGFDVRGGITALSPLPEALLPREYPYTDGRVLFGFVVDGKSEGPGIMKRSDGSVLYEGEYRNGKRNGQGAYFWEPGSAAIRYEGSWADDQFHGQGTMFYADEKVYDGSWARDVREGAGREYGPFIAEGAPELPDGIHDRAGTPEDQWKRRERLYLYDGQWKAGKRSGHGILTTACRIGMGYEKVYDGLWQDGRRHGAGTETWYATMGTDYRDAQYEVEFVYEGTWDSGTLREGREFYRGRLVYEGGFQERSYSGAGTLYREDGGRFVGQFQSGKPLGKGAEYDSKGSLIYEGTCDDGIWDVRYEGGYRYVGEMEDGFRHGRGRTEKDGVVLEEGVYEWGAFKSGRRATAAGKAADAGERPPRRYSSDAVPAARRGFSNEAPSFLKEGKVDLDGVDRIPEVSEEEAPSRKPAEPRPEEPAAAKGRKRVGKLTLRDGSTYRGEIANNAPDGRGILETQGEAYDTTWERGRLVRKTPRKKADGGSSDNSTWLDWLNGTGF